MRVGEALALWVQDVDVGEKKLHICDRGPLENGAEIKTLHAPRAVDVSTDLIDEIVAYIGAAHTTEVETNHLFIKRQGTHAGQALTYADVDVLFRLLRSRTGIAVIMRDYLESRQPSKDFFRACSSARSFSSACKEALR